ncbi:DUF4279 domain-containing protein [Luedemannella helvata]|uniref:Transposase n=1 Tax=Luedemannella helvata TaxID=349315 RepID=A0ABP4X2R1_9ACTN
MRVRQYVYFALAFERVSAAAITAEVGLEPEEVGVRDSRLPYRPVPRSHSWKVVCRDESLFQHEQIEHVIDRVERYADRIAALTSRLVNGEPSCLPGSRSSGRTRPRSTVRNPGTEPAGLESGAADASPSRADGCVRGR